MEPQQPQKAKTTLIIVILILIIGLGYVFFKGFNGSLSNVDNTPETAVIENTPLVDGALPPPAGLPTDLPLETGAVVESVTTNYPDLNARQLSVSYESSKTVEQKYNEYKDYMTTADYTVTEGDSSAPVRAVFGVKDNANLSVVISSSDGKTLVQVAYLLKSTQ